MWCSVTINIEGCANVKMNGCLHNCAAYPGMLRGHICGGVLCAYGCAVSRTLSELSTCCKKATYWWMGRSRGEEGKGRDEKEKCNTQLAHSCIGVLKFASCTTMTMSRVMAYGILLMLRCLGVG